MSIAPIVAVAGPSPHALAVALDDQGLAVMLDFVNLFRAVRDGFGAARDARCKGGFQHGQLDSGRPQEMRLDNPRRSDSWAIENEVALFRSSGL